MASEDQEDQSATEPTSTTLLRRGLIGTAIYLLLLVLVICSAGRSAELATMALPEWGTFAGGALGPLALLWVILTFRLQQTELRQNTETLRLQALELRQSVEAQRELVAVARAELQRAESADAPYFVPGEVSIGHGECPKFAVTNRGGTARDVDVGG